MNLKANIDLEKFEHVFTAIDSHTVGEFTRVIIDGIPELPGQTMMEKKQYFQQYYDYFRTALVQELRGHRDMFVTMVMEPINKDADFGIIYLESDGYLNMCGHGTIGTATITRLKRELKMKC